MTTNKYVFCGMLLRIDKGSSTQTYYQRGSLIYKPPYLNMRNAHETHENSKKNLQEIYIFPRDRNKTRSPKVAKVQNHHG